MGYAIAEAFLNQGAKVILISGPVNIKLSHPNLKLIQVVSAFEMFVACSFHFPHIEIAVFAAAVADYKCEIVAEEKIKKAGHELNFKLVKNIDIAFEFGKLKNHKQLSIGFALETNDELKHTEEKLNCKNFDMVFLNSMNDAGATFEHDTNKVTMIQKDLAAKEFPVKSKVEVANDIIKEIAGIIVQRQFYSGQVFDAQL